MKIFKQKTIIKPIKLKWEESLAEQNRKYNVDFSDVKGQENVKKSLEIAAAGT